MIQRARVACILGLFVTAVAFPRDGEAASVNITATEVVANSWKLTIEADIFIGDGAIGILNAVSFTPNISVTDQFYSCAFQTCGTQGPGASGSGVQANAVYFQWAASGNAALPFAYGNNIGSPQLIGTFTSAGPVTLTFAGLNALFGTNESQPLSDFITFAGVPVGDIALNVIPEPTTGLLFASGLLVLSRNRAPRKRRSS